MQQGIRFSMYFIPKKHMNKWKRRRVYKTILVTLVSVRETSLYAELRTKRILWKHRAVVNVPDEGVKNSFIDELLRLDRETS